MKTNRYTILLGATAATFALAACGGGEVVVQAELEGEVAGAGTGEVMPLRDLMVRLLPYDRDVVFDSLEAAYPEPEPQIPDTLLQLQDQVAAAQDRWLEAQSRWNVVRDSLQRITREMEGLSRGERRYRELFNAFQDLEVEERQLRREMEQNFEEFDTRQRALASESAELRILRDQWAEEAYRDIDVVLTARLEEAGREEEIAHTDADGAVRFRVAPGRWWVVALYELPYQELYWNLPIEVGRGEPVEIRLSRENAQVRPAL